MGRNFYIFSNGTIRRKENTVFFETEKEKIPIPIEDIEQIFLFGEINLNTKFLNFMSQKGIVVHIFNYYGWYSGSFYPKENLVSGVLLVKQVQHYIDNSKRLFLASAFVDGAISNLKRNLEKRQNYEREIEKIKEFQTKIKEVSNITELMSIEAHVRKIYYSVWEKLTGWEFGEREIRPPKNPLNAMISFGNSLLYAQILKEIYETALNPTISYLHEPQERRFSLALDIAEIFKPIFVDRLIFKLINNNQITLNHFEQSLNFAYLNYEGRKIFVKEFDNFLNSTLKHRTLKRKVKYRSFIKLELYKLIKHLLGESKYKPLKVWW